MAVAASGAVTRALARGWQIHDVKLLDVDELWFTGKLVARVELGGRQLKASRHPRGDHDRLAGALGFQDALAESAAVAHVIPASDGRLVYDDGDHLWTLSAWLPGAPVPGQDAWTLAMLEQAGCAVGALHYAGASLVECSTTVARSPERYWTGDWHDFISWAHRSWTELSADDDVRTSVPLAPLRDLVDDASGNARMLSGWDGRDRLVTVTHDDLWTAHFLWTDDRALTGIVDLDGLDAGYAIGDVAALVSDFADLEPARCHAVVRGYTQHLPLGADDLGVILAIVVRHHLLVLIERARLWRDQPRRRSDLLNPLGFWCRSLRSALTLDPERWATAVRCS